ncbi:MAG: EscU/YscU/HrcU family type III secretion system export apparatus switch protein [Hyphomonas sp.]|nr:EscU/YscU/HrcU family type III secretion system export apparatus switch protein [Hyphomonas sp.]
MSETEKNKTEEATPFKLKRARQKGQVAKGPDLGFLAMLSALTLLAVSLGPAGAGLLAEQMKSSFAGSVSKAQDPAETLTAVARVYGPALRVLTATGISVLLVVALAEMLQVGGLHFTPHPLKPDFNRLNPAKGLKRLFSMHMLKQTLKSIAKLIVYCTAAFLVIRMTIDQTSTSLSDARQLSATVSASAVRLLLVFTGIAAVFAVLDQVMSRQEFRKQMRMSKSELTREHKEREGEPRLKQRRRQLHAEFAKQAGGAGGLKGSDMLIINPEHFAVALRYDPGSMLAPVVTAKGRNRFALLLKQEALRRSIPTLADPALARALFKAGDPGREIPPRHYEAVAAKYLALQRLKQKSWQETSA